MKGDIPARVWIALLVAPLVAFITFVAGVAVALILGGEPALPILEGLPHASFFFALFGLPFAYAITLPLGLAGYRWLRARGPIRASQIITAAVATGVVAVPGVSLFYLGGPLDWTEVVIGATAGLVAGAAICAIAGRDSTSRAAI